MTCWHGSPSRAARLKRPWSPSWPSPAKRSERISAPAPAIGSQRGEVQVDCDVVTELTFVRIIYKGPAIYADAGGAHAVGAGGSGHGIDIASAGRTGKADRATDGGVACSGGGAA